MTCPDISRTPSSERVRTIDLPAGIFRYHLWDTAGPHCPPAVLLHANASSAASWSRVAPALADRFRVYAMDLRGHGGSVRPTGPGAYRLRTVADDVLAFLEALRLDRPLLVGHSWGAAVALVTATGAETDRPVPAVSGLVLEDPSLAVSPARLDKHLQNLLRAIALPVETLRETVAVVNPSWHETDIASLAEGLGRADPTIVRGLVADGARSGALLPLLARLTAPVLLFRADPQCGGLVTDEDWAMALQLLPPGSTALDLPGVPHEIHRACLDRFIEAVTAFSIPAVPPSRPAPSEPKGPLCEPRP